MKLVNSEDGFDRSPTVKKGAIKHLNAKNKKRSPPATNDGINTPVPNSGADNTPSESEKALFKQAENPLGDPHKT